LQCPQNLLHAINIKNNVGNNLQGAISLNMFQCETVLLATGIFSQRGNLLCISKAHLEYFI
jgi:hypothetical protein